jgi:hypothetical protein
MALDLPLAIVSVLLAAACALSLAACGSAHLRSGTTVAAPASESAATIAASEKREPGSDDNVAEYGREATPEERRAISSVVIRYYAAAAVANGGRACGLLVPTLAGAVVEDYGRSAGPAYARGRTCAEVMTKIFKHIHPAALARTKVTGVRVKGDNGLVELRNRMTPNGAIDVRRYRGSWWLGVLIAHEIPAPFRKAG